MRFVKRSRVFLAWFWRVIVRFFGIRPGLTLAAITFQASSKIAGVLAFMLPLKVILLAGSEGVPKYFQFFIDEACRTEWIAGLTLAAVILFLLTLILDTISEQLSVSGARDVVAAANKMAVVRQQEQLTQKYFMRFTEMAANSIFVFFGGVLLAFINFPLLAFVLGFCLLAFLFTAGILRSAAGSNVFIPINAVQSWILNGYKLYISILNSVGFLMAFLLIVYPYFVGKGQNIIFTLVSFLVVRQVFRFFASNLILAVQLLREQATVDALFFPSVKVVLREKNHRLIMRDLFTKVKREALVKEELLLSGLNSPVRSEWLDSTTRGVTMFLVSCGNFSFIHQVVDVRGRMFFEREDFLFKFVGRKTLHAAPMLRDFSNYDFYSRLVDVGTGQRVSPHHWKEVQAKLFEALIAFQPPAALVNDYCISHSLLSDQLDAGLFSRVCVALDSEKQSDIFQKLLVMLPRMRQLISDVPLYIHNPDLREANVFIASADNDYSIVGWGRWSVQTFGYGLPAAQAENYYIEKLEYYNSIRAGGIGVSWQHIKLVALGSAMIECINSYKYKRFLVNAEHAVELMDRTGWASFS